MGVATNHFLRDVPDDIGERQMTLSLEKIDQKDNMEQYISEFFADFIGSAIFHGVYQLIYLFDKVQADSFRCLFLIPRAPVFTPESFNQPSKRTEAAVC